jgi:hypothetical protein
MTINSVRDMMSSAPFWLLTLQDCRPQSDTLTLHQMAGLYDVGMSERRDQPFTTLAHHEMPRLVKQDCMPYQ